MAPCTRRHLMAPAEAANREPLSVSTKAQPARRARGKRANEAAHIVVDDTPPAAVEGALLDLDGEAQGNSLVQRLDRRRVIARRPRGDPAEALTAAAPAGPAEAPDATGEAAHPSAEAAETATAVAGATRARERQLWAQGYARVAGVDEAGRGPLAGPVVAAACVLPPHVHIPGIGDSRALSAKQREALYEELMAHPDVDCATSVVSAQMVDEVNILQAALAAMSDAVAALDSGADYVIVDGNRLPPALECRAAEGIIKGDAKCTAIAAASIVAKVTRDRLMDAAHAMWPHYGFISHKGYGTAAHVAALREHGPCVLHRRSFAPLRTWLAAEGGLVEATCDSEGL